MIRILILSFVLGFLTQGMCQTPPNIVVIIIDDAGYADFGFNGSKDLQTPHIDRLARHGIIFTDAHVTSTVCAPSRAGLLTGRYQQRFGFECNSGSAKNFSGIDTTEIFLTTDLRNAGYTTAAIGKWHLGYKDSQHPNKKGFDYFYGFLKGSRTYFYEENGADKPGDVRNILENNSHVSFEGYLTDVLASKAAEFINMNREKRFFIYWAPNAVHTPMEATKDDLEKYEGHPRQELAAMTHALDRGVGTIVEALKTNGLFENTLIFFLSDNGGANNNQSSNFPLKGFKGNEFEGGHRVPFVVSWPAKIKKAGLFKGLTSSLDIYPTCLEAAGNIDHAGKPLDGVSLMPYLTSMKNESPHDVLFWRKDQDAAVRYGDYKMIRVDGLGYRLYDLKTDLAERVNLTEKRPGKFELTKKAMAGWENQMSKPLWVESKEWKKISWMIHEDLYNNRPVRVKNPRQLTAYLKKNDSGEDDEK